MSDGGAEISRTALVLLDLQAGILGSLADSAGLLDRAARAVQIARRLGVLICHVRVVLTPEDRANIPPRNKVFWKLAQSNFLAEGSQAVTIPAAIEQSEDGLLITKKRVSAFAGTSLHETLRHRGVDTLAMGGVYTSGAVLSTLRDAADRDYRVLILHDLCADPRADVHRFLFDQIFPSQGEVLDVDSFGHWTDALIDR
jgi:nicotinamidase-related amidase